MEGICFNGDQYPRGHARDENPSSNAYDKQCLEENSADSPPGKVSGTEEYMVGEGQEDQRADLPRGFLPNEKSFG